MRKVKLPLVVAAITFMVFLPVLWNEFSDFDDYTNLVGNVRYRGLGWTELRWAFTTFHNGHYRPLTWLTFGVDYLIWGMNPTGYHLTSLLIHCANAILFYFVARRLIGLALPGSTDLTLGAGFAALLFAIHPLRVEAVALASDRKELLATFFFLWVIHFYLRGRTRVALGFFVLSLLSKGIAMTAPALLLILDWYPLARLGRKALWEKIPFALIAVPFALANWLARSLQPEQWWGSSPTSLEHYGIVPRLAQTLFSPGFFAWKTFVLYDISPHFHPSILPTVIIVLTVIVSISLYILRKRWPAGLACWLYMVASLAPVLGWVQVAPSYMADRYSYLACLSWAVLGGGMLLHFLQGSPARTRAEKRRRGARQSASTAAVTITVILTVLSLLTWNRTQMWRTSATLLTHIVKIDSSKTVQMSYAHEKLGTLLAREGNLDAALKHFQTAAQLNPNPDAFHNMGTVFAWRSEWEKAARSYERALALSPNRAETHASLAKVFSRRGQTEKAEAHFRTAIALDPNLPFCVLNTCM